MSEDSATAEPRDWFREWERSVARWWDAVLDDPAFVEGMSQQVAGTAQLRAAWEEGVDQTMHRMHLPAKKDMVRLARIASLLEDRLVTVEDRLDEVGDRLERIEREVLQARVDAAEALVRIDETLRAIRDRLGEPER
jgi:hypothetical protein